MRHGMLVLSIAGFVATSACALAQSTIGTGETARPAPIPQSLPHSAKPVGILQTSRIEYTRGSTITFHFDVNNQTSSDIHYDFSTTQQFDIAVMDSAGNEVWRWSKNRVYAQRLTAIDLQPGQVKRYTAIWNTGSGLLPPGSYTATATLTPTIRPAVRGGLLVNPDVDPNNIGAPTEGRVERGVIVQVNVTPSVSATTKFTIMPQ